LLDLSGKVLVSGTPDASAFSVPASGLAKGIYLLSATDADGRSFHRRLILE
jgi:glutamine synthetase type III